MSAQPVYALCDWGTSSFRVWIVDASGAILGERRSHEGLSLVPDPQFAAILEGHLRALDAPARLPVVICGMAGARQGWVEVPYIEMPFDLAELSAGSVRVEGIARAVFIIPGVAQRAPVADVMRGEETQILGTLALTGLRDGQLVLPGTHSKWVSLEKGQAVGFRTVMTGEVYALLSEHSILRHSLGSPVVHAVPESPAFQHGVRLAGEMSAVLSTLFAVRAETLLNGQSPAEAASFLSGLLIGAEISEVWRGGSMTLVASGAMASLYGAALSQAGVEHQLVDADVAVRRGLLMIATRLDQDMSR